MCDTMYEEFDRLLTAAINNIAHVEGKRVAQVEAELGVEAGYSAATIQRYKKGHVPPNIATIKLFAQSGIKRGLLGREWLMRFLRAARLPERQVEEMMRDIVPTQFEALPLGDVRTNLPPAMYSDFVTPKAPYGDTLKGMRARNSVVLLFGMGGIGKTSLARELASRCMTGDESPRFDAVVWVSDRGKEGKTSLEWVTNEIMRVLGYPGLTQRPLADKLAEVEKLLRSNRVLLVIDNFETIEGDRDAIASWLIENLPDPSKAIVTSREYLRTFKNNTWQVEMRGMGLDEAQLLINSKLQQLGVSHLFTDLRDLDKLVKVTSGNPLAMEMTLGSIKHHRITYDQALDELSRAVKGELSELFDHLFRRSWSLLQAEDQRVLFACGLFRDPASRDALRYASGLEFDHRFNACVGRLADLALLDVEQASATEATRFALHPLLKSYLESMPQPDVNFLLEARARFVSYYYDQALMWREKNWGEPRQYDEADPEVNNIDAAIAYMQESGQSRQMLDVVRTMSIFWNTRGYTARRERHKLTALEAAEALNDHDARVQILSSMSRSATRRDDLELARELCEDAKQIVREHSLQDSETLCELNFADMKIREIEGDFECALRLAQENVALSSQAQLSKSILYRYDVAEAHFHLGRLNEAEAMLKQLIPEVIKAGYGLRPMKCWLLVAKICVQTNRDEEALRYVNQAEKSAVNYKHQARLAEAACVRGLVLKKAGHIAEAREQFKKASQWFRQLWLVRKMRDAEDQLFDAQISLFDIGNGAHS